MRASLTIIAVSLAAASAQYLDMISDIPQCAISCILSTIQSSTKCGVLDTACQCTAANIAIITSKSTDCIVKACSLTDAETTVLVTGNICAKQNGKPESSTVRICSSLRCDAHATDTSRVQLDLSALASEFPSVAASVMSMSSMMAAPATSAPASITPADTPPAPSTYAPATTSDMPSYASPTSMAPPASTSDMSSYASPASMAPPSTSTYMAPTSSMDMPSYIPPPVMYSTSSSAASSSSYTYSTMPYYPNATYPRTQTVTITVTSLLPCSSAVPTYQVTTSAQSPTPPLTSTYLPASTFTGAASAFAGHVRGAAAAFAFAMFV